ncbi:MAG: ABC transporter permease [Deltaproteobacteria bacterium]|jgi:phospholipid/cholesterol/gamma-HCH transport system permease protein|nr:ABC transporter permease [Deltaproteobacteria bacterium]
MLRSAVERLGTRTLGSIGELGRIARFGGRIVSRSLRRPFRFHRIVREAYDYGVLSLAIVCASGLAVGLVFGLQLYYVLVRFGAEETLGAVVGLSMIRELGPVLTGLLVTGRAGSAMAAEIGMMVATEQIDGMRTMAVDPVKFVVAPKAIALTLSMPLLSALFIVASIFGSYLVGVRLLGLEAGIFLASLESAVVFDTDIVGSGLKALLFGALVALIATFRGYTTGRSTAEVSRSTTSTVVTGSVCILLADYIFTSLWGF